MKKTKNFKSLFLVSLVSLSLLSLYGAKIYKWDSNKGETTYSDLPPAQEENYEVLEMKKSDSMAQKLINKTTQYRSNIEKKLQDYKTFKEHHNNEDISPMLQKLKSVPSEDLSPQGSNTKNQKNCAIAQNNLDNLNNSNIILDKNKKLSKLSKFKYQQQIKQTEKQIGKFC